MQFSVYQQSHIGGRKVNQDRMGYCYTRDALLLVLADGMGGHVRGEVAATITMQTMSAQFQAQARPYVKKPERFLEEALLQAHEEIVRYGGQHQLPDTPRTTVVACLVQHNHAVWAHCGDSRLYWLRRGQILGRTRDHSHVEYLIERGRATPAERNTHPDRNKLYNCLGASNLPRVELSRQALLVPGDVIMLCSDGLWSMLPDTEIAHQLSTQTVVRAVPDMISMATAIGGARADNTTALAIMWQGSGIQADPALEDVISTQMLDADHVSSTIVATPEPVAEGEADVFDEEAIERAIAEIRDAIEKSSQLLK
ncbi:PP2C family protein-serine/threonine phosphatase [Massilia horti]|uniref:Serine/threonine-protein phosphatase n=1 Tax=Massilia horti TaxID=2562153 RepID=A0A4Y9SY12_9BURK|nr:PP2C family serine/threonine-protein phosphatase [Massilia horti]TFW29523.1 serine/threonine-protein phosphatase [Massilia horti]